MNKCRWFITYDRPAGWYEIDGEDCCYAIRECDKYYNIIDYSKEEECINCGKKVQIISAEDDENLYSGYLT